MRQVVQVVERTCTNRYQEGTGQLSSGGQCWCETDGIGNCGRCGTRVCGDHSEVREKRVCVRCSSKEDLALAEVEAARVAAEAEQHWKRVKQKDQAVLDAHAQAIAENRRRYGPEEPVRKRLAALEQKRSRLIPKCGRSASLWGLVVLAFVGYLVALGIGGLVFHVILGASDEVVNRIAPTIMSAGAGLGAAIGLARLVQVQSARSGLAATERAIKGETLKLGCGSCSACLVRSTPGSAMP